MAMRKGSICDYQGALDWQHLYCSCSTQASSRAELNVLDESDHKDDQPGPLDLLTQYSLAVTTQCSGQSLSIYRLSF
jgi:hypothetical protein